MAEINSFPIESVKVGELAPLAVVAESNIPHEVGGVLYRDSLANIATYITNIIETTDAIGFLPISVDDGDTLPALPDHAGFFLAGAGTFINVGGAPNIVTTEKLNAIMTDPTLSFWVLSVEIPIDTQTEYIGISQLIRSDVVNLAPSEKAVYDALAGLSGGTPIISKTYAELTALIASNGLIQGQKYLLSDYETTYTQPVTSASKSSGVTEPLILTAVSDNAFSQIAFSELHPEDIVYYEITGDIGNGYGDEGFTKGKIYRRIDTLRNNDIGTDWRYVKYDRSGTDKLLFEDYTGCQNNIIKTYYLFDNVVGNYFQLNTISSDFFSNTIGDVFQSNIIGYYFQSNIIGDYFFSNTIGDGFDSNTIGVSSYSNRIGDDFYSNTIVGYFQSNTIGYSFQSNTISSNFSSNTIGDSVQSNDLTGLTVQRNKFTVATLPSVPFGQDFYVTDALTPTYLSTVVGGGTITCKVFYNGTNWVCN